MMPGAHRPLRRVTLLLLASLAVASAQAPSSNSSAGGRDGPFLGAATGAPPGNPTDPFAWAMANNVYQTRNYYIAAYHYVQCWANSLVIARDTKEVAQAVAHYHKRAKEGVPVTLRASRPMFHSSSKFPCPNSPLLAPGAKATPAGKVPLAVGVLQHKLTKVLATDYKNWTIRVGAGIRWTEFLKESQRLGMSVQIGTPTVYAGLTLAGVLATTAHGSGDRTACGIWNTLLEITWVDGTGAVRVSKPSDPEFRAMNGGLGVFGVMTEFLIRMTPPTDTTLVTVRKNDTNMLADIEGLLKITPHILVFWRPDIAQFKAFLVMKAKPGSKVERNAQATLLPNIKDLQKGAQAFKIMTRNLNDDKAAFEFLCPLQTEASIGASWASVNGTGMWNVTGPTNQMQASECDEHCNWSDQEVFNGTAQDVEFTIEFEQLAQWIKDVRRIIDLDLFEGGKARYRCLGPGFLWLRFGSGYNGFTATVSDMKRPVFVQSTWLRSRMAPDYPMRYQFVLDLIEELTLCKFNGRPHWGKNFQRTFTHPTCGVRAKYPKFDELLKLQAAHDPARMFEPRLFSRIVKRDSYKLTPRCSLWMDCYCQEDINCPVKHKCVPALSFPQYKVCKADYSDKPDSILPLIFETMQGN